MAREYGVGRSTLREAVKALAHMGLVEVRPGDGTYVRALPHNVEPLPRWLERSHVIDVYEVRQALELDISRLACERRDAEDLDRMRAALERCARHLGSGDEDEFLKADLDFHLAVATATKNEVFLEVYAAFCMALRELLVQVIRAPGSKQDANALHARLIEAIEARNAEQAQEVTQGHLSLSAGLVGPRPEPGRLAGQ